MKIWHRAHLHPEGEPLLRAWGIKYKSLHSTVDPNRLDYLLFDIDQSNPAWPHIAPLMKHATFVWTEFTQEEILNAEWLRAWVAHKIGYPAGEDPWSERYYERGCSTCGVGWRQKAPFRVNKEPRLGKNDFASFWGGFELLCTPKVLDVFEAQGIHDYEVWPVLLHKTGEPSQCLRQLIVPTVAEPALVEELAETERFRKEVCARCGNVWYSYYTRGMLPLRRAALRQDVDFQLTREWFGNGRTARREILVSQKVAWLMVEQKWKGLDLWPAQLV